MNEATATKVVIGSVVVSAVAEGYYGIRHGLKATPPMRTLVAGAVVAGILLMLASIVPGVAGPFAILIALGIVVTRIGK